MADSETRELRITVTEAYGLPQRTAPVQLSVRLDGRLLGRSHAVPATPSARWDYSLEVTCPQASRLLFEVTRAGWLPCTRRLVGGCTVPVSRESWVDRRTLPLWDSERQTVGSLLVSIQSSSDSLRTGGLTNRASAAGAAGATLSDGDKPTLPALRPQQSRSSAIAPISRSSGGGANAGAAFGNGGLVNLANSAEPVTQPTLAAAGPRWGLQNHSNTDLSAGRSGQLGLQNQASNLGNHVARSATLGLQNQAEADAETGTRKNALPRAKELLNGLVVFSPEDSNQCLELQQAVEELRHVPSADLQGETGQTLLELCSSHIDEMYRHALKSNDDKAVGSAHWLAGRLPQLDGEVEDRATLQDMLRQDWNKHQMEVALDRAEGLLPQAETEWEALDAVMGALDLAETHAARAEAKTRPRLDNILSQLQPHVPVRMGALLDAGQLEQVEGMLNAIGAGRREALRLQAVQQRLDMLKGINLVRNALTPTVGQIGFPALKQRILRHATMAAKTAMAGREQTEIAGELESVMLDELLPKCVAHSCGSTLAALQTAFTLLPTAPIWVAMHEPYEALDVERKAELAEELPRACHLWGAVAPEWLLSPEQAACLDALHTALGGADLTALQEALLQVKGVEGGRELCAEKFEEALNKLREQHHLPEGWNVESMLAGQAEKKLLAKQELTDRAVLHAFDKLLKSTLNPVWTRDRKGRVTKGVEAVKVVHVMNATTWTSYVQRRDEILSEYRRNRWGAGTEYWRGSLNGALMTQEAWADVAPLISAPPLQEEVNEGWYLHGTSHVGAAAISSDDFDMARARPTGLYGAGIYLAESVSKSDEYVKGEPDEDGVELFPLLVCRACLGNVYYCAEKLPDRRDLEDRCLRQRWHSVLGDRKVTSGTFREFIVYDPNQVFPGYIVYYKRSS